MLETDSKTGSIKKLNVENGVKFMSHPNVQSTPLSERVKFLEKKGLSADEIDEVLKQVESSLAEKTQSSKSVRLGDSPVTNEASMTNTVTTAAAMAAAAAAAAKPESLRISALTRPAESTISTMARKSQSAATTILNTLSYAVGGGLAAYFVYKFVFDSTSERSLAGSTTSNFEDVNFGAVNVRAEADQEILADHYHEERIINVNRNGQEIMEMLGDDPQAQEYKFRQRSGEFDQLLATLEEQSTQIKTAVEMMAEFVNRQKSDVLLQGDNFIDREVNSNARKQSETQAIADLKAEVNSLKTILLASSIAAATSSDAGSKAAKAAAEMLKSLSGGSLSTAERFQENSSGGYDALKPHGEKRDESVNAISVITEPHTDKEAADIELKNERDRQKAIDDAHNKTVHDRCEAIISALRRILISSQNSLSSLQDGLSMIVMYIKNLIENPEVPRYRRISTSNTNFRDRVSRLDGYEDLFLSLGFKRVGMYFEWNSVQGLDATMSIPVGHPEGKCGRSEGVDKQKTLELALNAISRAKEGVDMEENLQRFRRDVQAYVDEVSSDTSVLNTLEGINTSPKFLRFDSTESIASKAAEGRTLELDAEKDEVSHPSHKGEPNAKDRDISDFNAFLTRLKPHAQRAPQPSTSHTIESNQSRSLSPVRTAKQVASELQPASFDQQMGTMGNASVTKELKDNGRDEAHLKLESEELTESEPQNQSEESNELEQQISQPCGDSKEEPSRSTPTKGGTIIKNEILTPTTLQDSLHNFADEHVHIPDYAESNSLHQPHYPESFMEVMKLVKEGQPVPGIRQIPNQMSVDAGNPSTPRMCLVRKPWEIYNEEACHVAQNDLSSSALIPIGIELSDAVIDSGQSQSAQSSNEDIH